MSGGFGVDGGTVNISGGEVDFKGWMINNGGDADIAVTISKNAKISNLSFVVYMDDAGNLQDGTYDIHLTINGGYFDVDPATYKTDTSGCNQNYTDQSKFITYDVSKVEQYTPNNPQADWDADASIYTYRIKDDSAPSVCAHANTEIRNAKAATCNEAGFTGDTYCKDCNQCVKAGTAINAFGHDYDAPSYVWSKDGRTCTATAVCKRTGCAAAAQGHTLTETVNATGKEGKKGVTTYTAAFTKAPFKTQTKDVEEGGTSGTGEAKADSVVTDPAGKAAYTVTSAEKNTVAYKENKTTGKKVKVPASVKIGGKSYKVTSIAPGAFKGNKKITGVTIGTNVTSLGDNAFSGCTKLTSLVLPKSVTKIGKNTFNGCKKLGTITIKSTKLTTKTISKGAFKGISKKTVIKVPKSKKTAYTKLFRQKGLDKKVQIKGI
ncbi:MAG: leucine-rich repeat domain-containing protein [Lachnospiraceae bacterium]|nr:leucine-rich repeat domain-containing protein [Lachnospiraceae bacterium]